MSESGGYHPLSDVRRVCQEAFHLLRQDDSVLTDDNWSADNPPVEVAKCRLAVDNAINEVVDEFRWSCSPRADNVSAWPSRLKGALAWCLARELAIPIAGRIEDMKNYDALYRDKILQAKIRDFDEGKANVTDEDAKMVFALIRAECVHGDQKVPHSLPDILDRIAAIKDMARREVLMAQDWNFAKRIVRFDLDCPSDSCDDYRYEVPYPRNAVRLVNVFTVGSARNEWKVEDGSVRARRPITAVKYTADVADMSKWSAFARTAYIHRLAADVARTVMDNQQDAAIQEQAYAIALENARLRDSRESSTPTDAWGENFYAERMHCGGFDRPAPWER